MSFDANARNNRVLNTFHPFPVTRSVIFLNSFIPKTIYEWNQLPVSARTARTISIFKRQIKPPPAEYHTRLDKPRYTAILYLRLKYQCSALNDIYFILI